MLIDNNCLLTSTRHFPLIITIETIQIKCLPSVNKKREDNQENLCTAPTLEAVNVEGIDNIVQLSMVTFLGRRNGGIRGDAFFLWGMGDEFFFMGRSIFFMDLWGTHYFYGDLWGDAFVLSIFH